MLPFSILFLMAIAVIPFQVFDKVRDLFKDQEDLLKDFSQFLPEAHQVTAHIQQERNKEIQGNKLSSRLVIYSEC